MEPLRTVQQDGKTHLVFNTHLSVSQARALHAQLGLAMATSISLVLDASQVEQVDTAAMQVLAGFCRHLQEQGSPPHWQAVSPTVQQAGHLLGLGHLFGDAA